jgi:hypothetical protein
MKEARQIFSILYSLTEVSHLSGKAYTTGYVIISKDFYLHYYSIITKF